MRRRERILRDMGLRLHKRRRPRSWEDPIRLPLEHCVAYPRQRFELWLVLQVAGLIEYRRGHITVLDRAGLERRTCECHAVVKTEYDRLLPNVTAT